MKKKTLAKSFPNKLIKELMKREGLKSQVKIGDMREVISKLGNILISPAGKDKALRKELENYLENKHSEKYGLHVVMNIEPLYAYYFEISEVNKAHRKSLKKKAGG